MTQVNGLSCKLCYAYESESIPWFHRGTACCPTFWTQAIAFCALPDSPLVHLICVTSACPHTGSLISHNVVIWSYCKIQEQVRTCETRIDILVIIS